MLTVSRGRLQLLASESETFYISIQRHVQENFGTRLKTWIRLRLSQTSGPVRQFFDALTPKQRTAWIKLINRAAQDNTNSVWEYLSGFRTLSYPPEAAADFINGFIRNIHASIGPLPVTMDKLQDQPVSYLGWLREMLKDLHSAQGPQTAPKLYTLLPRPAFATTYVGSSSTWPA